MAVDLLEIKIEQAKRKLPLETVNAIDAVDWRAAILSLRNKKGYTLEQLSDLELETELLLSGLTTPQDYPKELEHRMGLTHSQTNDLVNDMNELVFQKIREEFMKNTERKEVFNKKETPPPQYSDDIHIPVQKQEVQNTQMPIAEPVGYESKKDNQVLKEAGINIVPGKLPTPEEKKSVGTREEILHKVENPEPTKPVIEDVHPLIAQNLLAVNASPIAETDHSLNNISKTAPSYPPHADPYRVAPE